MLYVYNITLIFKLNCEILNQQLNSGRFVCLAMMFNIIVKWNNVINIFI